MRNRYGTWNCLSQRKENVGATQMSSDIQSTFMWRGKKASVCVSQGSRTEQTEVHTVCMCVCVCVERWPGLQESFSPGSANNFHLFPISKQLVVTICNTVLRRILRLSPRSPGPKNAVTDNDVCWGRKGPLLLKYHVFYAMQSIGS